MVELASESTEFAKFRPRRSHTALHTYSLPDDIDRPSMELYQ